MRFIGDWGIGMGIVLGLVLAGAVWWLYQPDVRNRKPWVRRLLPALRALAVFLLVLIFTGPVLHTRKVVGQLSRLFVFVDVSQSMGVKDPSMPIGRKILAVRALGWIPEDAVNTGMADAAELLAEIRAPAAASGALSQAATAEWAKGARQKIDAAFLKLKGLPAGARTAGAKGNFDELLKRFQDTLVAQAKSLDERAPKANPASLTGELSGLAGSAAASIAELQTAFDEYAGQVAGSGNASIAGALKKFDAMPRLQRVEALLLGGKTTFLKQWAATNRIELFALSGREARQVWQSMDGKRIMDLPESLPLNADGHSTDLADGIRNSVGDLAAQERAAVILFSDGQHNDGASPVEMARTMGVRHLPIFAIGVGSQLPPMDLAVCRVDGPQTIYYENHFAGQVLLNDHMPPGKPFSVRIECDGKTLWEQQLTTDGKGPRKIPFDFAVKDHVEALIAAKGPGVRVGSVALAMKASVTHLEQDQEPENDSAPVMVCAVTQKSKVLVLDGRPRWEWRYLRNLFDRDQQWELNALVGGAGPENSQWTRGDKPGTFPATREALFSYDLIIFGEVPREWLKPEELGWIKDFVGTRGGGIIFIDGHHGVLPAYAGTPLETLLPVDWKGPAMDSIASVALTSRGENYAPLALDSDRARNSELWRQLKPPHWIAHVNALPGAETLVEAINGGSKSPAVVLRQFGPGKVLYFATDESWRWRYEVADLYHARIWSQIANAIVELPFAVRDSHVALDAGRLAYEPGEPAHIRARLTDAAGNYITKGDAQAVLFRDGQKVSVFKLAADEGGSGVFRGVTGALEAGHYEIGVRANGFSDEETKLRAAFDVSARETGELSDLNLNEDLLRQMAGDSGGSYLREEQAGKLNDLIAPLSQGKVVESDILLWQSYWWFVPVILLFTLEWVIRKRAGML